MRLAAALVLLVSARAFALEIPARPEGRVSDYAGALTPAARARLDQQLGSYETGGRQMAVAIFRSLDGQSLEDVSMRIADRWKLGDKQSSNGLLLTVFLDDHKLRFEVGYGLEGELPDALCGRIIREVIAPRFRSGDLESGLREGFEQVHQIIGGAGPAAATQPVAPSDSAAHSPSWLLLLVAIIFLGVLRSRRRLGGGGLWRGGWMGGGRDRGGGGFGGGGGGFGGGGAGGSW